MCSYVQFVLCETWPQDSVVYVYMSSKEKKSIMTERATFEKVSSLYPTWVFVSDSGSTPRTTQRENNDKHLLMR
jgi:hypothetical protein